MSDLSSTTLGEALKQASNALTKTSDSAKLDAEVLLCHALNVGKTILITASGNCLSQESLVTYHALVERRRNGEPIAYITGVKEFWSLDLRVTPDVLIPRAETELLVEVALAALASVKTPQVIDLGTGSGAIALAIAKECPGAKVIAVDNSKAACDIAAENAQTHALSNVEIKRGSWFEPVANRQFDLIVSNPPYIKANDEHLRQGDARFEPASALVSGVSGLDAIAEIVSVASNYLKPHAVLAVEHGYDQGEGVKHLFLENNFKEVNCSQDLAGRNRVTFGFSA
ncbi:MAG: peptide chain release factor N(5)-glutamine methyltransferase [Arenicellales bacterium WSBS_2016_MAG_OTU3]